MNIEIDTHTHTLASGHAYNTLREMAAMAAEKDLKDWLSPNILQRCLELAISSTFRTLEWFQEPCTASNC